MPAASSHQLFRRVASAVVVACLVALPWLLSATAAGASGVADLYEAEVRVADRDLPARADGFARALQAVLVKLTGDRDVDPARVLEADTDVAALADRFQYVQGEEADATPLLRVRFDAAALDALLASSGLPQWPRPRPLTALFIGMDVDGQRSVLSADDSELARALLGAARQRGLPVLLPLMDLQDQRALGPADLWGGFEDRLRAAAARYGADALVHARLTAQDAATWSASWALRAGPRQRDWQRDALSAGALAEVLIDAVVDELAGAFSRGAATGVSSAPATGAGSVLELVVTDIDSPRAYASALGHLRSLDLVERVDVRSVAAGRVVLAVHFRGREAALRELIDIGNTLVLSADGAPPEYRLNP